MTGALTEKLPDSELQRRGVCLLKLHLESRRTGLYGRIVVVFQSHHETLPSHNITPGDIVGLTAHGDCQSEQLTSGIVTRVVQSSVSVAFDDTEDLFSLDDEGKYKLYKLANDVTYKRLKRTLKNLRKNNSGPAIHLTDVLFGLQELSPPLEVRDIEFLNKHLDDSQREAVQFALTQREVAIVHGPPGTGKTTTVIEIIHQAVQQGNKVLACAPSNIAVDNLVERLAAGKHKIVRLGHPARVLPHIQKYSLDAILSTSDETKLVEDVRKDLDATLSSIRKTRDRGEKQKLREDMKFLRKELKTRTDTATRDLLKRANVVLGTLTSATNDGPIRLLDESHFDLVVIDEVSQALEAACWIPLLRTGKCVLAGDHLQLPPTILSKEAAKDGLEVTLMERVLGLHGDGVMKMLTTQYRMHEKIMRWSADELYESKLVAHASVEAHLLRDITGVDDTELTATPLLLIDTAGCDLPELDLPEEISKGNEGEADIVAAHVGRLIDCGVRGEDIAVIAPYNLQVELIRLRLGPTHPTVEVKSVDGFQGREKEAVVISLVRSNSKGEVGFLSERRRINVAVTRARRHLAVVGDSETVSHDDFLKSLVDYLTSHGEVQTAQEFIQDGCVHQSLLNRPAHLDSFLSSGRPGVNKGARPKVARSQRKQDSRKPEKFEPSVKQGQAISMEKARDNRVDELAAELAGFASDMHADTLQFPSNLTARDRFLVHELSQELSLSHISKGTAEDRYIVVSKPGSLTNVDDVYSLVTDSGVDSKPNTGETLANRDRGKVVKSESSKRETITSTKTETETKHDSGKEGHSQKEEINTQDKAVTGKDEKSPTDVNYGQQGSVGKVVCKICGKDVIRANIQLHELHCAKAQKVKKEPSKPDQSKNVSKSAKSRQFDKELAERINKVDSDDIDSLIATVKTMDNFCCLKKCKTSVQTLFNLCQFCQGRYCMSHQIPEVHGCGEAARTAARAQISRDGVLHRGSGAPGRKPNADKKAQLQRKMDSKLTEMASKRKGKPKK